MGRLPDGRRISRFSLFLSIYAKTPRAKRCGRACARGAVGARRKVRLTAGNQSSFPPIVKPNERGRWITSGQKAG